MGKKLAILALLAILGGGTGALSAYALTGFNTELRGSEEVPPVQTDTNGQATLDFNDDLTAADFSVTVDNGQAITMAHLHCAPAGENGPVVVTLFGMVPGGFNVDGTLAAFTLRDANIVEADCPRQIETVGDLYEAVQAGEIYVNVHSVSNPNGLIRGQFEGETGTTTGTTTATTTDERILSNIRNLFDDLVATLSSILGR